MDGTGRRARWCAGVVGLVALLAAGTLEAGQGASGRRVAFVVGNDAYTDQSRLRNAANDARAVAAALRGVGFTVTMEVNAPRARLVESLGAFAGSLRLTTWRCSTSRVTGCRWTR